MGAASVRPSAQSFLLVGASAPSPRPTAMHPVAYSDLSTPLCQLAVSSSLADVSLLPGQCAPAWCSCLPSSGPHALPLALHALPLPPLALSQGLARLTRLHAEPHNPNQLRPQPNAPLPLSLRPAAFAARPRAAACLARRRRRRLPRRQLRCPQPPRHTVSRGAGVLNNTLTPEARAAAPPHNRPGSATPAPHCKPALRPRPRPCGYSRGGLLGTAGRCYGRERLRGLRRPHDVYGHDWHATRRVGLRGSRRRGRHAAAGPRVVQAGGQQAGRLAAHRRGPGLRGGWAVGWGGG
jgi:hypothetical protein